MSDLRSVILDLREARFACIVEKVSDHLRRLNDKEFCHE